jgi:large subunit ribosomal protein L13
MVVIDGTGAVFGRLATQVAKALLNGEEIQLVNSENMLISGDPKVLTQKFLARRRIQNKGTPEYSPKWPKVPHLLVKRMIRGMLPHKSARGREAIKRLMVYTGNPKNLKADDKFIKSNLSSGVRSMKVRDLCKMIGYEG